MRRIIRDNLYQLFSNVRYIKTILLANQSVPMKAQKSLHSLADIDTGVVDHLQQQHMSGMDFVVKLMHEKTQLSAAGSPSPMRNRLQDVPDVGSPHDEDV